MEVSEGEMSGEVLLDERPHIVWIIVCDSKLLGYIQGGVQVMELFF